MQRFSNIDLDVEIVFNGVGIIFRVIILQILTSTFNSDPRIGFPVRSRT